MYTKVWTMKFSFVFIYKIELYIRTCVSYFRVIISNLVFCMYYYCQVKYALRKHEVHTISIQTFFVPALNVVVDSWKFIMLLLYILWDDWLIFMISGLKEQLQQQLKYILLKPDSHSWWISKMKSGHEEERYAMKFCFKLGKNVTEMYGMLPTAFGLSCMNLSSVFEWHKRFKEGKESVRNDERCGRRKEVNTPGLGLLFWGFKGVQEEIPSEEASTLQIGSVVFPAGACTSPQLHPFYRLFDQDGHQEFSSPSL